MSDHFDMPSAEQPRVERPGSPAIDTTRFVDCDCCGGDGEFETYQTNAFGYRYDPRDGSVFTDIVKCRSCGGTGVMEIEVEPIEQEDLPS